MGQDERDSPLAELVRDEREDLFFVTLEARWLLRVFLALAVVSSVCGMIGLICVLVLGADHPGKSALRWCTRVSTLAVVTWLPMLMMGFAWSAQVSRNRAICYALAIALFAVVALGGAWLLRNAL